MNFRCFDTTFFSILKSREKTKDDSSRLRFLVSLKWQVLRGPFPLRSLKRRKMDFSRDLGRGDYQTNRKTAKYFLRYDSQSSRMLCSVHCDRYGDRHSFLSIKDAAYCGLPKYTRRYVGAQVRTGTCQLRVEESPNQQWKQQLPGFTTPEYVSSLDL